MSHIYTIYHKVEQSLVRLVFSTCIFTYITCKYLIKPGFCISVNMPNKNIHLTIDIFCVGAVNLQVHPEVLKVAEQMWTSGTAPSPVLPPATETELKYGLEQEELRNKSYLE